jgi:hypothetical protein
MVMLVDLLPSRLVHINGPHQCSFFWSFVRLPLMASGGDWMHGRLG